jgi:hypothetical protein
MRGCFLLALHALHMRTTLSAIRRVAPCCSGKHYSEALSAAQTCCMLVPRCEAVARAPYDLASLVRPHTRVLLSKYCTHMREHGVRRCLTYSASHPVPGVTFAALSAAPTCWPYACDCTDQLAKLQAAVATEHIGLRALAVAWYIAQQGAWLRLFILTAALRIRYRHCESSVRRMARWRTDWHTHLSLHWNARVRPSPGHARAAL